MVCLVLNGKFSSYCSGSSCGEKRYVMERGVCTTTKKEIKWTTDYIHIAKERGMVLVLYTKVVDDHS